MLIVSVAGRAVTVCIGQRVGEDVLHVAGSAVEAGVGIATVRSDGQRTKFTIDLEQASR